MHFLFVFTFCGIEWKKLLTSLATVNKAMLIYKYMSKLSYVLAVDIAVAPSKHPSEDLKLASITIPQSGGNRTLQDDVSIDFPEGFIDDPRITFKYGVFSADYFGPCLFPPGVRPVSAILVLHPENENVRFKPGVKITMPHCLWLKDAEDCRRVKILKAETADYITVHGRKVLKFNEVSGKEELSLFTEVQNVDNCGKVMVPFASHYSCHCCCYCIGELYMEDTNTAMFCLAQSKPKNLGESSEFLVQYTLSYFLKTCFRVCFVTTDSTIHTCRLVY